MPEPESLAAADAAFSTNHLNAELHEYMGALGGAHSYGNDLAAGNRLISRIVDWVSRKASEAILTPELKQRIKAVAVAAFDTFDIPYIGGVVEAKAKDFLRPILERLLDQVLGIAPGAVAL